MIVEIPGLEPWRSVRKMRAELNARAREAWERDQEDRKRNRAFLEDDTDWSNVRDHIKGAGELAARQIPNNDEVRTRLIQALAATEPLPEPIAELTGEERFDGFEVRLQVHEKRVWLAIAKQNAAALEGVEDRGERTLIKHANMMRLVATGVLEARGMEGPDGPVTMRATDTIGVEVAEGEVVEIPVLDDESMRLFERNSLIGTLHELVVAAQRLPADFLVGFGR